VSRQQVANRIIPPFIVMAVIAGVWYTAVSQIKTPAEAPKVTATSTTLETETVSSQVPVAPQPQAEPLAMPTVQKRNGLVQFSVTTKKVAEVKKVDFYVGKKFMGSAYTSPFQVTVDENNFQPGNYKVTAKIYTGDATAETPPATFSAKPTKPVANAPTPSQTAQGESTPAGDPAQTIPGVPGGLHAVLGEGNASVVLAWSAPTYGSAAVSYQVWRDGSLLANVPGTGYTDTAVTPGSDYTYHVVAVDAAGNTSVATDTVSSTLPQPVIPEGEVPPPATGPSDVFPQGPGV
jgi:hypothetical protein